jgi:hypothetical protein
MKVTCELIHLMGVDGKLFTAGHDSDWHICRVAKILTSTFSLRELNRVEDFLSVLGTNDLKTMACGEGEEVADLFERMSVLVEDQMLIEEVVNCAFEEC